jgi:hypothetical protein
MTLLELRSVAPTDEEAASRLNALVSDHLRRLNRKIDILQRLRDDLHRTARLLPVCCACTQEHKDPSCRGCERVPKLQHLPQAFRLTWRARELDVTREQCSVLEASVGVSPTESSSDTVDS